MTPATTSSTASIVKTLGTGSGLDTGAIVSALVEAQFAAKNAQLTKRSDTLTAQISGIAKLKSGITGFDAALRSLVKGGSLATQPTSSSPAVAISATSKVGALSGTLTVNRLAAAQAATTNVAVARTAAFRTGTLDVTIGGTTTSIAIDGADATLDGVAARINAAGLGLTATIVNDSGGARLTVKGATGAANAFTIAGSDADPAATGFSLADLSVGAGAAGTTIGSTAADAELVLDGATFTRSTNGVTDLIAGVRLDLKATGTTTLGTTPPSANLAQAVNDFVATFNELQTVIRTELDPVTGVLRADPAAAALRRSLGQLTTVSLADNATGAPRTLGDIGVRTGRDGTLSVDATRLTKALADFPQAVEAMFADGTGAANGGLSAALGAITTRATDRTYGFDAEAQRYSAVQADLSEAKEKAESAAEQLQDRLTRQFASMDARVAAYKSQQAFMKQQIDAWAQND